MSWVKPGGAGPRIHVSRFTPGPVDGQDGDVWFVLPPPSSIEVPGSEGWEVGSISASTGKNGATPTRIRTIGSLPAVGGNAIQVSWEGTYQPNVLQYAADESYLGTSSWLLGSPAPFTLHADAAFIRLLLRTPSDSAIEPSAADIANITIAYGGG